MFAQALRAGLREAGTIVIEEQVEASGEGAGKFLSIDICNQESNSFIIHLSPLMNPQISPFYRLLHKLLNLLEKTSNLAQNFGLLCMSETRAAFCN